MKRRLIGIAKIAVPVAILLWIVYRLVSGNPQEIADLLSRPKNWPRILGALTVYITLVVLTFVRWFVLVRCLEIPFRFRDALRLGFIGYLLQFVSLGAVGGDLFKAVFIAREQPHRKPEAVATVVVDRFVGMLGLLILASVAVFWIPTDGAFAELARVRYVFVAATVVGLTILFVLLFTKFSLLAMLSWFRNIKPVREILLRFEDALRLYRQDRGSVMLAIGLAVLTHFLHGIAIYIAATAFFPAGPKLSEQIIIWTVAGSVGSLPIAPGGLGTFEVAYSWLYERLSTSAVANEGVLVALLYRMMTLITAAVGVLVYFACRKEMREILRTEDSE